MLRGTSREGYIANLWKDHFSEIENSVGSTDSRDQVMIALRAVPRHNDVVNVHKLRHIVKGLKNNKAVISGCILTGKLPSTLMYVVIIYRY